MEYFRLVILGLIALIAAIAADWGRDLAYSVHAVIVMLVAVISDATSDAPSGQVGFTVSGVFTVTVGPLALQCPAPSPASIVNW